MDESVVLLIIARLILFLIINLIGFAIEIMDLNEKEMLIFISSQRLSGLIKSNANEF